MTAATTARDANLVKGILQRAANDLAMIIDRPIAVGQVSVERAREKAAAEGGVHLSFRLEFSVEGEKHHGCILVPLPDAIAAACYLMVMPDESVKSNRSLTQLDRGTKDAMLEISNFIGGATDAVLRVLAKGREVAARSDGCQGVAPGAKPNFRYASGDELIVARAEMTLHDFPTFTATVQLPAQLGSLA